MTELRERIATEYGPHARIVSAERVTVGGLGGFLARRHIEAVIEVRHPGGPPHELFDGAALMSPDRVLPAPAREPGSASTAADEGAAAGRRRGRRAAESAQEPTDRSVLMNLLSEADGQEAELQGRPGPAVSTGSDEFDRVMDGLVFGAKPSRGARAAPVSGAGTAADGAGPGAGLPEAENRPDRPRVRPMPLQAPGDLVVVVGLGADAMRAAVLLAGPALPIHGAGGLSGATELNTGRGAPGPAYNVDRKGLLQARAAGVGSGEPVFVACALDHAVDLGIQLHEVESLGADQLWVAVDAGRKSADTRAWVEALDSVYPIDAVAVFGSERTASPETVLELGIPVHDMNGLRRPGRGPAAGSTS